MNDKLLAVGRVLMVLATTMVFVGASLAVDAAMDGRQSLTAALLSLWALPSGLGGFILVLWRTE